MKDVREDGRRFEIREIWGKLMTLVAMKEENSDKYRELYEKLMAFYEPICKINKPERVWEIIAGGDMDKNIESLAKYERYAEIWEIYEILLVILEALDEKQQENYMTANMKKSLSICCIMSGDSPKARSLLDEILPFYQNAGDELAAAEVLDLLGHVCVDIGDTKSSKEYLAQALAILEKKLPEDSSKTAGAALHLGTVYSMLLDYPETKKYYEYALSIFQKSLPESLFDVAKMFHNLGLCLRALSDYPGSKKYYEQALQILEQSFPEDDETIDTLLDCSSFYSYFGDKVKEDECNKKALMILERTRKELTAGKARSFLKLGQMFTGSDEYVKAEQCLRQALKFFVSIPTVRYLSEIFTSLADLYYVWASSDEKKGKEGLAAKRYELSKKYNEDALKILLKFLPDNAPAVASAHLMIGWAFAKLKNYSKAQEYLQIAYEKCISYSKDADTLTAFVLFSLGQYYDHMGKRNAAIYYMKLTVNMVQNVRATISKSSLDKNLQRSYADSHERFYRALADMLAGEGRIAEAQRVMGMMKEEELSSFIRRNETCDHQTTTIPYIRNEEELRRRHEELENKLRAKQQEKEKLLQKLNSLSEDDKDCRSRLESKLNTFNSKIASLKTELGEFFLLADDTLKKSKQEFINMNDNDIKLTQNTLKEMGHGAVLLQLSTVEDRVNLFFTAPNFPPVYQKYEIKKDELMRKIFDFRRSIEERRDVSYVKKLAKELYDILICPVSGDLKKAKEEAGELTLIIFLDGALRYAPVCALYSGDRWLIQDYSVTIKTVSNSLSIENGIDADANVAAMGVTHVPEDIRYMWSAIPWVEKELKSIVAPETGENKNGLPGIILLNNYFSKHNLEFVLDKGVSIVHIATHYKFILESPSGSFLLLGDGYYLTLDSIKYSGSNFSKIKLVTFSCCETALNFDGKDVEGLPEVIMLSGARSVIATLFSIDDHVTANFMPRFYEILKKGETTKAEALCLAQREFIEKSEYAHPCWWSPFVLYGDWS